MTPLPRSSGDVLADRRADYAEMLFGNGEAAPAAELMMGALELAPGWALGWFRLGEFHEAAGAVEEAAQAWRMCLKLEPLDRPGAALKLALIGAEPPVTTPPSAFVEALFDQYAPTFDASLVEKLGYRVPDLLLDTILNIAAPRAVLAPFGFPVPPPLTPPRRGEGDSETVTPPSPLRGGVRGGGTNRTALREGQFHLAVDLGCGTGLMGERLRPYCNTLIGYDISSAMLKKAEAKGVYDRLEKADLQALDGSGIEADLVVAADVFMYLGALEGIFGRAQEMLLPGGLFVFSVEAHDGPEDFVLRPSRRYAHSESYVRKVLDAAGFAVLTLERQVIRMDRNEPVEGFLITAAGA